MWEYRLRHLISRAALVLALGCSSEPLGQLALPRLVLGADAVDFGDVMVGDRAERALLLSNVGGADAVIHDSAIEPADGGFLVDPASLRIAPGAQRALDLSFVPTRAGAAAATLLLRVDGVVRVVALAGRGFADAPACADAQACDDRDACTAADSCLDGVCIGSPLVCAAPPPPSCVGAASSAPLAAGTCDTAGACRYDVVESACAFGCSAGECLDEPPCAGASCPAPRLVLLDGYDGGVYRSEDEGGSWQWLSTAPIAAPAIVSMTRAAGGALVATTSLGAVLRSTDGGESFETLAAAPWVSDAPDGSAATFVRLTADPTVLYAASGHSQRDGIVYRSADSGETWSATGSWPMHSGLALGIDVGADGALYIVHPAAIGGQLLRSDDGGATFAHVGSTGSGAGGDALVAVDSAGNIYATALPETTFVTSDDDGATWMARGAWLSARSVSALHIDVHDVLFAVSVKGDVLRSDDGAGSWLAVGDWGSAAPRDVLCCSGWIALALL